MRFKYNIALVPANKTEEIVEYAQQLSTIAAQYILGANPLPHVTIYQFEAEEANINDIWAKISGQVNQKSINLIFKQFSCLTFDEKVYWASLLPDQTDILMHMHELVARVIGQPIRENYDPHMTLINSYDPTYVKLVEKLNYNPIEDMFVLSLGRSDDLGQYTEILYFSEP